MSHAATSWAYRQQVVSAGRKFVLVALADFADEAWSCYPGQDRLAAMTGQSVRSVRGHLARLEADGLIARQSRFLSNGQRTSDRYRLLAGVVESVQPPADIAGGKSRHRQVTTGTPADVAGYPLVIRQETPQPPASGGRDHCSRHTRHRKACDDCVVAAAALTARPAWCGRCDETTRLLDFDGDAPRPCPDCRPNAERTSA